MNEPLMPAKPLVKAGELPVGQKIAKQIPTDGDARIEDESDIEIVDRPLQATKAELLRFMEEPVKVVVHRTADKLADPVVEVWNGGIRQMFIRGVPIVVKRKFVELLARARDIKYEQQVYVDKGNGEAVNRMIPVIGLKYAFDVLEDRNPRGPDWLKNILQEV